MRVLSNIIRHMRHEDVVIIYSLDVACDIDSDDDTDSDGVSILILYDLSAPYKF